MVKIVDREVGSTGYGLMGLTWRQNPPPVDQSFAAMRAALSNGATFWNGGELYGSLERNSLHLLNEYFAKYPEDADKIVLSIKGGLKAGSMTRDGSRANVQRSIDYCLKMLDGKKKLDLFECARVDTDTPIEETISTIAEYVKAGKVGGIGLSEASAKTIRRAHAVHPIAAVEIEFSLYATQIVDNGVAQTCAELGIPIIAYSPLCRGFLTGAWKKYDDLPNEPALRHLPRFQPEVFEDNLKLAEEVGRMAKSKGVTPAQIALGWVISHGGKDGFPEILALPGATTAERVEENMKAAKLDDKDMARLADLMKKVEIKGPRYAPGPAAGEDP